MTNRMKFLTVLLGVLGLSGCIVVDDEVPVYYSSYPAGSYESAIDYYHRPPRPNVSRHGHNISIHKKEPHIDKPKHISKPAQPIVQPKNPIKEPKHPITKPEHSIKKPHQTINKSDNPVKEIKHPINKPDHSISKPDNPIKDKAPQISHHSAPKADVVNKPAPSLPKQPTVEVKKTMPNLMNVKSNPAKTSKPKIHHHR